MSTRAIVHFTANRSGQSAPVPASINVCHCMGSGRFATKAGGNEKDDGAVHRQPNFEQIIRVPALQTCVSSFFDQLPFLT